ncbi:MAG: ATP-grasp domain-containing protein [Methanoregulaceae archaeon]|nr:ATP-grasp domain-containing protein [Methanoregulaceae archaeon]
MRKKVLVAGFATRHVVQSAFGAGYEVYAVDHFCDQDLSFYARESIPFADLDELPGAVEEMCRRYHPDIMVVTSGAEALSSRILWGTAPEKARRFLDKLETHRFFEEIGVPAPALLPEGVYPSMVKPRSGSGGWRNRVIRDSGEREAWKDLFGDIPVIIEELAEGVPCSVCCLANGKKAVAVAVNRQVLRGGTGPEFGFCGSVTPFRNGKEQELAALAERIAATSGCIGTLGVDFVSGDHITAIELNPRFQATLDTVEMATGLNLFSAHVAACRGILPEKKPSCRMIAVREILFADKDLTVGEGLRRLYPAIADIPWPGSNFEEGQAVISVYGWGTTSEDAKVMLDKHIRTVFPYMEGKLYGRGSG